jgi:holin-like protein
LGLPVPGSVIGMLLLLLGLVLYRGVPAFIDESTGTVLKPLILYYVPASVGIMSMGALLAQEGLRILLVMVLSTLIPLVLCGYGLDWWLKKRGLSHE